MKIKNERGGREGGERERHKSKSFSFQMYYHIVILVYFTVGSTSSGSAFVIAPILGAKTIFESYSL